MFTRTYDRLSSVIDEYRECFTKQQMNNETNDIVYNKNYKLLYNSTNDRFITILLHVDGIGLSNNNKESLWLLSCSIIELPPAIRIRRQNNLVLSMWISNEQPNIYLWLTQCIQQLSNLKEKGFPLRQGGRIKLKVYGVIADCPAMSLILNHISHVGNALNFSSDSVKAQRLQTNIRGRLGISILDQILDIPLPKGIIADYLHVTLLRHAKTVCLYIYKKFMKPKDRFILNEKMAAQRFPHFFQRTIRKLDEKGHKASEMRNLFLYCLLPMVRNLLKSDQAAHLGLFVTGIRIDFALKSIKVGDDIAPSNSTLDDLFDKTFIPHDLTKRRMTTQREKRIRRPRNVFSPSDIVVRPTHYLLYFDATQSYTITLSSSIHNITDDTAMLYIHGKKTYATIITKGTFETCENEYRQRIKASQENCSEDSESSDDENDDVAPSPISQRNHVSTFPLLSDQRMTSTQHRIRSSLDENNSCSDDDISEADGEEVRTLASEDTSIVNQQTTKTGKKRKSKKRTISNIKKRRTNEKQRTAGEIDNQRDANIVSTINIERTRMDPLKQIENHLTTFQNMVTKSLRKMEKKIDSHISSNIVQGCSTLDQYRTQKGEVFPDALMYNNQNLLNTPAKSLVDFSRKVLKMLYSQEELKTHLLPPKRAHLTRPALDENRFNILLEAIRIKFRLDADLLQKCFHDLIKTKLSNFLYEERRRAIRKTLRNKERALIKTLTQQTVDNFDEREEEETNCQIINHRI
ncbi:unnamed protein product [Rotaria magnacalcarata]|uniref:BEN domain-containing protein n=2 Tax=Rotaria magnacalcarata TaxID=392030 RepID=A0A819MXA7_9BILA|nr:unnamed protein product [Rotaria magnacalcarata]